MFFTKSLGQKRSPLFGSGTLRRDVDDGLFGQIEASKLLGEILRQSHGVGVATRMDLEFGRRMLSLSLLGPNLQYEEGAEPGSERAYNLFDDGTAVVFGSQNDRRGVVVQEAGRAGGGGCGGTMHAQKG